MIGAWDGIPNVHLRWQRVICLILMVVNRGWMRRLVLICLDCIINIEHHIAELSLIHFRCRMLCIDRWRCIVVFEMCYLSEIQLLVSRSFTNIHIVLHLTSFIHRACHVCVHDLIILSYLVAIIPPPLYSPPSSWLSYAFISLLYHLVLTPWTRFLQSSRVICCLINCGDVRNEMTMAVQTRCIYYFWLFRWLKRHACFSGSSTGGNFLHKMKRAEETE